MTDIKLTEYSHGAGCGCKIAPDMLEDMLGNIIADGVFPNLLVGNTDKDDAAVYAINDEQVVISTTDFFMPIVDDPYDFGRIAATNALSDIYAMGGTPIMAISIFGWPIDKLPAKVGKKVIEGGMAVCNEAGIPLAGGHSIDSPEPIFGLAVTGTAQKSEVKTNAGAQPGDVIYLTKPLGIGVLTTAEKRKILLEKDAGVAARWMLRPNRIGMALGKITGVHAVTDVTGFGLVGHLTEICEASKVTGVVEETSVPRIPGLEPYLAQKSSPGGMHNNYRSFKDRVSGLTDANKAILCDPQTSGGLLITVAADSCDEVEALAREFDIEIYRIGMIDELSDKALHIR